MPAVRKSKSLSEEEILTNKIERIFEQCITEKIEKIFERKLKEHEENITKIISANTILINKRFEEIDETISDFKESLEYTENELKEEIKSIKQQCESENIMLRNKLRQLEDRSRRNNIRIEGVNENENETWDDTTNKVEEIIKNRLRITKDVIIERAHRGGSKQNKNGDKPRTIFAKLLNYRDKEEILKNANKLKDTGIYINEDFSKETTEIRKELWLKVRRLRDEGMYAYIYTIRQSHQSTVSQAVGISFRFVILCFVYIIFL